MQQDPAILQDVEIRLKALTGATRLRPMVGSALAHLQAAKSHAAQAEPGSAREQQYLREATEASQRLALLQEELYLAERDLRRTAYLTDLLAEPSRTTLFSSEQNHIMES